MINENLSLKNEDKQTKLPEILIEPMIFEGQDGKPLIPAMDFFAGPLDPNIPLPEIQPLGPEYYINWREIDKQFNEVVFPDDYINEKYKSKEKLHSTLSEDSNSNKKIEELNNLLKTADRTPVAKIAKAMNEPDSEEKSYSIMRYFISQVSVRNVKEQLYVYSGISYVKKTNAQIYRLVVQYCRNKLKNKSSSFIEGIVNFLKMEPDIFVSENNVPRHLVAFQNCVLNVKSRTILKQSPEYLTLYEVKANYQPYCNNNTPIFDDFLYTVSCGDLQLIQRIWQMIGYTLTPDTNAKCFFLLQGLGDSGKSVLANLMQDLFNDEAYMPLKIDSFNDKFSTSNLIGATICSIPDLTSKAVDENIVSILKQLTGNDRTSSNVKFGAYVKFVCLAKLVLTTNHALLTKTADEAFYYRACTIPFKNKIDRNLQDRDLPEKLKCEYDAIVTKAISAYYNLVDNNYEFAGNFQPNEIFSMSNSTEMDVMSKIYEFVKFNFCKNDEGIVFIEDAHNAFVGNYTSISINEFSSYFQQYVSEIFDSKKSRKRRPGATNPTSCIIGISFKEEDNNDV